MLQNSSPTNSPINYSGLNVGTSQWNLPIPIFWGRRRLSTNAMGFYNFTAHPLNGKGKGANGKNEQKTYTADVLLMLGEGPIDEVTNIWADGSTTTVTTLSALGMIFFAGTISQAPWALMVSQFPAQARAYSQTAYLAAPGLKLGESATIPDNAFECLRFQAFLDAGSFVLQNAHGGWIDPNTHDQGPSADCLLSDIVTDLLTNVQYGMGFASGDLGSMTQFATYQRAQGLFFSPLLVSQEKCTDILDRWATLGNSWIYWSGTALQFVPLGDSAVTGNGVTYTPIQDVAYDLGPADFITDEGEDSALVKVTRIDPADAHNRTVLSFTDRTLGYIDNPVEWRDDRLVSGALGLRDDSTTQADEICDPGVAAVCVQLLGKRNAYVRNTYEFKTTDRMILCLPGTILTLTEPNIGLNKVRVRVKTIDEDEKDQLSFVCEEFPGNVGTYYPPATAAVISAPTTPIINIAPGSVNTPAIIEPNSAFTGGVPRIIVAASGGVNWGGCTVMISFDGTNYSQVGTINSPASQGLLTANIATLSGSNPDTTHTLAVDCTESLATPSPVTNADAQALRTLSLIAAQPTLSGGAYVVPSNGELLAFGAVTATGTYAANLTYLERGQYGTSASAHSIGDQFTQINVAGTDGTTVEFDLPAQYVGATIYLKLCSFNVFGQALQDPSTVLEYQYTPTGAGFGGGTAGIPQVPTGLASASGAGQNVVTWNANPATDNVTSYSLYAAAGLSQPFSAATLIWAGLALFHTDSGLGNSVSRTYFLVAHNAIGASANTAGANGTTGASGVGTVTSVGLTVPAEFTVSGSPVTGAGTLAIAKNTQTANTHYAGPGSGAAAAPTFRALVGADLPAPSASSLGGVQSLAAVAHKFLTSISTSGVPVAAQPASTDLSDLVARTTFTPTVTFATPGDLTVSYATQTGAYVKIGPLTLFWVDLAFTPTYTTASGNLQIGLGALPSPTDNNVWGFPLAQLGSPTWPGATDTQVNAVYTSGGVFFLRGLKSGANGASFTTTQLPSGVAVTAIFSGCFF